MCENHTGNVKSDNTWSVNVRLIPHITPSDGAGSGVQSTTSFALLRLVRRALARLHQQFKLPDRCQQGAAQTLHFGHLLQHGHFFVGGRSLQVAPCRLEVAHEQ